MIDLTQASNLLQQLLDAQTALAEEKARENALQDEALRVKAAEAENEVRRLDLEAQDLALKRETLNRAEERHRFMALGGLLLSGLFALAILLTGIPALVLEAC